MHPWGRRPTTPWSTRSTCTSGAAGPAKCDQYLAYKEHYTDSCGNQFYKCVADFDRPAICNFNLPDHSLCSGGI